jgi:hypothetical protein
MKFMPVDVYRGIFFFGYFYPGLTDIVIQNTFHGLPGMHRVQAIPPVPSYYLSGLWTCLFLKHRNPLRFMQDYKNIRP